MIVIAGLTATIMMTEEIAAVAAVAAAGGARIVAKFAASVVRKLTLLISRT